MNARALVRAGLLAGALIVAAAPRLAAQTAEPQALPPFVPPVTDEDREAAFPEVEGHAVHDRAVNYFVLFDRLEWQSADGGRVSLDGRAWVGGDLSRLWVRFEGDGDDRGVGEGQTQLLYGRHFARWWDVVAGIRQDVVPGPAQTWAAIGVQGLAPYWFEIEATAYVGAGGRTRARFEAEYDLLVTNRLVVQPVVEVELSGKADRDRGLDAGLNSTDAGIRIRYEFRREVAPYVGVAWKWKHGETGERAGAAGEDAGGARLVAGLRVWF